MPLNKQSPKADIEDFQLNLEFLGCDLSPWGADGKLGSTTRGRAHDIARKYNLPPPVGDDYPDDLVKGVDAIVARLSKIPAPPAKYVDLTQIAYPGPRVQLVPWTNWKGFAIHQTSTKTMGLPSWTRERIYKRWADFSYTNKKGVVVRTSLRAHFGIMRDGTILHIHPLEYFIWHAQGLSHTQWGFEFEGCFQGIPGDSRTTPGGSTGINEPTDEQIVSGLNLMEWLIAVGAAHGTVISTINPHRVSTDDRDPDCGQTLYQKLIMVAMKRFGLTDGGPGFKLGKGHPVPHQWNPAYPYPYSNIIK